MSCNLISGMYQRLDKMRKAAFASACLFGTDNDSSISGIWVWRGHELAFTVGVVFFSLYPFNFVIRYNNRIPLLTVESRLAGRL